MADARSRVGGRASAVQLEFGDVCEMELIHGDPEYTAWLVSRSSGPHTSGDPVAGEGSEEQRHAELLSHPTLGESPR
jgi:hypothetical protein